MFQNSHKMEGSGASTDQLCEVTVSLPGLTECSRTLTRWKGVVPVQTSCVRSQSHYLTNAHYLGGPLPANSVTRWLHYHYHYPYHYPGGGSTADRVHWEIFPARQLAVDCKCHCQISPFYTLSWQIKVVGFSNSNTLCTK